MNVLAKRILCMQRIPTNVQSSLILAKQSGFAAVAYRPTCSRDSVSCSFWARISCSSDRICSQSCGQTCDALSSAAKWRCLAETALKNPVSTPKVKGCIRQESISAFDSIVKCLDFAARRFRRVWAARATSDHASLTEAWKAVVSFDSCHVQSTTLLVVVSLFSSLVTS